MDLPLAPDDVLRLEPGGTIFLAIAGAPRVRLRRPTIGEMIWAMDRWEEIGREIQDEAKPDGAKNAWDSLLLGSRWLVEVVAKLGTYIGREMMGEVVFDARDMPAWSGAGAKVLKQMTGHWLEVPLASGASEIGSPPNGNGAVSLPPLPDKRMVGQVILGEPVSGFSPSTG